MPSLRDETVSFISRQFFQQVTVRSFQFALPSVRSNAATEQEQYEIVCDSEVQHELYVKLCDTQYPFERPSLDYMANFLQKFVQLLERLRADIDDDLISFMIFAIANTGSKFSVRPVTTPQFGPVTYVLNNKVNFKDDEQYITINESRNMISGYGTTGYRTWEAALALGEYIMCQQRETTKPPLVDVVGKRIFELGAGTGFLSLLCGKLGAAKVAGSDGFEDVLLRLRQNVEENKLGNVVETRVFKWGNSSGDDTGNILERESREAEYEYTDPVDLILGADITFDAEICELLSSSVRPSEATRPSTHLNDF
ncbi:hypothetical protein V1509DRAFT_639680 [Lipomyces kononenkoae]